MGLGKRRDSWALVAISGGKPRPKLKSKAICWHVFHWICIGPWDTQNIENVCWRRQSICLYMNEILTKPSIVLCLLPNNGISEGKCNNIRVSRSFIECACIPLTVYICLVTVCHCCRQEAQLSLRDRATRACQLKSWQLLNDYTIRLTNTDLVSVSASRLTLKSIHIAATEVNCTDKLARL